MKFCTDGVMVLRTHSICLHIVPITSSLLQQRGLAGKIFAYLLKVLGVGRAYGLCNESFRVCFGDLNQMLHFDD
jgi:hypothetical protein